MKISKIFFNLLLSTFLVSCGLENMASKYNTVDFITTPPTLQAHAGKVNLTLDANFAQKYFAKQATVDFTPVLTYEGGETAFKTITIQGEEATGGEATIFNATGGSFKYQDAILYSEKMMNSSLELRAVAKLKDKEKKLDPVKLAKGVISTSTRVQNSEDLANQNHGYEHETILEQSATIYFLVNQSNIRTTEKSTEAIKSLKAFASKGYKTHSITVISYASPEGTVNTNDNISDKRMQSTLSYTKRLLRNLKVDGARNKDMYIQKSVGEDWKGFEDLVSKSKIKDKRKINKIVNSIVDVDVREQQIRDLAEIYDALSDNVLPQLRKATIIIKSYEPKKTDEEIAQLSMTNPEQLDLKELLFSATLTNNEKSKMDIYNKVVELHNDWRGFNNIACIYLEKNELEKALDYLNKAENIKSGDALDILANKGIIYSRKGDLSSAQNLFNQSNTTEKNQAILDIRQAEYAKAARFFKNKQTHNATLAKLLNGENNARCNEQTAECYYLNAIANTRSNNYDAAISNLEKAISLKDSYKSESLKDLEFINIRTNEKFIKLTN